VEEGGFSAPARSQKRREVTGFDLQVNSAQSMDLLLPAAVDFGNTFRLNDPLIARNGSPFQRCDTFMGI
jgi:hypothetical protein